MAGANSAWPHISLWPHFSLVRKSGDIKKVSGPDLTTVLINQFEPQRDFKRNQGSVNYPAACKGLRGQISADCDGGPLSDKRRL